jgi:hypothetical protein
MGECCTAAFAQHTKLAATASHKSGLIQGVVGMGSHRRVLLSTSQPSSSADDIELPDKNQKGNNGNGGANGAAASANSASGPDSAPKMNLPFAAKCFKNVVLLCNQLLETAAKANGQSSVGGGVASPSIGGGAVAAATAAGFDLDSAENVQASFEALDLLRQKALVNLAYVYLSMYEPQLAITSAKELLALPSATKPNQYVLFHVWPFPFALGDLNLFLVKCDCRFLARSYAAEALCMLSRAAEATQVLQSERDLMQHAELYAKEAKLPVRPPF